MCNSKLLSKLRFLTEHDISPIPHMTAQAAVVPALIGLAVTPLLLYKLLPPEVQQTPEAPAQAAEKLEKMGPMSRNESIMLGTMCFALVLWVRAQHLSVTSDPITAAGSGLHQGK